MSGILDSWPCNGLKGRFLVGSEATLALTGGSGGLSGGRRTHMGHTYPLPGSMTPQGALCPKLTRLGGGRERVQRVAIDR